MASLVVSDGAGSEAGSSQSREFKVLCSTRSSLAPSVEQVRRQMKAAAKLCGAKVEDPMSYPGWRPDLDSTVLQVMARMHHRSLTDHWGCCSGVEIFRGALLARALGLGVVETWSMELSRHCF